MIFMTKNTRCFNNYMDVIAYEDKYAVYNKINGSLVLLSSDSIYLDQGNKWRCTANDRDTLQYLEENLFFASDEYVQNMISLENRTREDYNDVTLVISLTEICNCACSYCYQLNWNHADTLSESEYKKWILEYISEIARKADVNGRITIKYFGGEPLLKARLMLEINQEIETIIRRENKQIKIYYEIDSNCTLLTREILTQFDNLSIATTLSLPKDHDTLRSNTFQKVINNLQSLSDLFEMPQYQLNIGYNAHHDNFADFSSFLKLIKSLQIKCNVYVTNIVNYQATNFINKLSDEDFETYYCEYIIPSLIENGFSVDILPHYGLTWKCDGTNIINRKFYSNGTQTLCSFFAKKQDKEPYDYPTPIGPHAYLDCLPEKCIKCFDFPYCGGERPCVKCDGSYPLRNAMKNRIKIYLDLQRKENLCTDI